MHKFIIFLLLVSICFILISCSLVGRPGSYYDSDKITDARLNQAIEAINNKDKNALKAMYSKQALGEASDFNGDADDLFAFIQQKIISWDRIEHASAGRENHYGHQKIEVNSYYYVNTDKHKYYLHLMDYPVDTDHPDNVGLYLLLVTKADDWMNFWKSHTDFHYAGIYVWENNNSD